jgi:HK97 family phage major capsid protein
MMTAPVREIAHWVPASRQAMDDAPALESLVDVELRYGLAFVEELQLLLGDGTGENIEGLIPQATAFDDTLREPDDNMADTLLRAVTQAELAQLPATGVIFNTVDWAKLMGLKNANGDYLGGGPFASTERSIWDLPKVATPAIPQGEFLVGAFGTAAQIFDRLEAEVLVSSEDRDNFIKNMLTIRAEERLALAVKRPEALIHGAFEAP